MTLGKPRSSKGCGWFPVLPCRPRIQVSPYVLPRAELSRGLGLVSEFTAFAVLELYLIQRRRIRMFGCLCMCLFHNSAPLQSDRFGHCGPDVAGRDMAAPLRMPQSPGLLDLPGTGPGRPAVPSRVSRAGSQPSGVEPSSAGVERRRRCWRAAPAPSDPAVHPQPGGAGRRGPWAPPAGSAGR